jgi:hypothetical protein
VEGFEVRDDSAHGYQRSDVERLLRNQSWGDYDQMITWLEQDDGATLSRRAAHRLVTDLSLLRQMGAPLAHDPDELYQELTSLR